MLLGLVLAAALAAAVAVVITGSRHASSPALLGDPLTVKRALSTTAAGFGDPVEAEVDVYTNDDRIPATSVRVRNDFAPYRIVATKAERSRRGHTSLLRTRITLECIGRTCLPKQSGGTVIHFRATTVIYVKDGHRAVALVPWKTLQLSSRLPAAAVAETGIIDTAPELDSRFERSPGLLQALLLVAAVALGLAGATLLATALWPSSLGSRRRPQSALESSLTRVETAARRGDEGERRRTLDVLATCLGDVPAPSLERRARALAWGHAAPAGEELTQLAAHVRASLNGKARG